MLDWMLESSIPLGLKEKGTINSSSSLEDGFITYSFNKGERDTKVSQDLKTSFNKVMKSFQQR